MAVVRLVLIWHQHQPIYTDPATGQPAMPWVRLHAIKDYWGMARVLERSGAMRATINLVPSLLDQLEAYAEGRAADRELVVGSKRTDELTEPEILFLLNRFFAAQWDNMIRPHERYRELLEMRAPWRRTAEEARRLFRPADLRDLAVLYDLVWFHPYLRQEDEVVRELWRKGSRFSEEDRAALHAREREILAQVIPLHAKLAREGRLELITSPQYHPILPLLVDFSCVHEAMPETPLPMGWRRLDDDARIQVARAISGHERRFGSRPRGMWPSEGSVSEGVCALLAELGVEWAASDEEVLERSLGVPLARSQGSLGRPDLLYRVYERTTSAGKPLRLVFRDHHLSDLIGFHYRSWDGRTAAADLVARIREIGRNWTYGAEPVVTIILDGENAWEHYPNQGIEFLEAFYRYASEDPSAIRPMKASDAISAARPAPLGRVFAGSWIDHNFAIWAGHEEDRLAWERVFQCRSALDAKGVPADSPAREELRIAEGSDWYWWFGDDHSSADDAAFDRLFRAHVKAAYAKAGLTPPLELEAPVARERRTSYTEPRGLLAVRLDGRVTDYFEWAQAGKVRAGGQTSTMEFALEGALRQLLYGADLANLYIRADFRTPARSEAMTGSSLRVVVVRPVEETFVAALGPGETRLVRERTGEPIGEAASDKVLELAIPWGALGASAGGEAEFFVQRVDRGGAVERAPREGVVSVHVPSKEDADWDWSV